MASACAVHLTRADTPPPDVFPVEVAWSLALGDRAAAPPAFDDERAYVALASGRLVAVSLATGRLLWSNDGPASLVAAGGGLAFAAGTGGVAGYRADSGDVAWNVAVPESPGGRLVWRSGWLVQANARGDLIALDASSGRRLWTRGGLAPLAADPSVQGESLYAPLDDGRIVKVALGAGELVWTRALDGEPARLLPANRRLYVGARDNVFYCLDDEDGSIEWRWPTGADVVASPVADTSRVYFASLDNVLRALNLENGAQRWRRVLAFRTVGAPVLAADTVVLGGLGTGLSGFRARDGSSAGQYAMTAELAAGPHVVLDDDGQPGFVVLTTAGDLQRLVRSYEPPLAPLRFVPGKRLPDERLPGARRRRSS